MTLYVATSTLYVLIFNKARFVGIILTTNPNFGIKMLSFLIIFIFGYMDKMFDVHIGTYHAGLANREVGLNLGDVGPNC
jgi:hypothetical protein